MGTKIEWTEETFNPITGCSKVSGGCENCYAARLASGRLKNHPRYQGLTVNGNWTGEIRLHPEMLEEPLHWRKPRMCFVCSMSDLFHESVREGYILSVLMAIAKTRGKGHRFQVLTKRADRMRVLMNYWIDIEITFHEGCTGRIPDFLWLGTTVENQENDWRIPHLLDIEAAVRFVSLEPLLGPIDLNPYIQCQHCAYGDQYPSKTFPCRCGELLTWVIVGAETGPGARYMDPDWARDIRDQCKAAGVAFFMKKMSNKAPIPDDLMIREYPVSKLEG